MINVSVALVPKAGLPEGFVYIDELIPDCIIDAKYAGTENFMGHPAVGYEQPLVVMSREAADGCVKAADLLRKQGYIMKFFDAFRPQRAVNDFCRWGDDLEDLRRKPIQYPHLDKARIFEDGYIARKSGHSRGSSVDLTIVDAETHQELDMGCGFDYMDPRSNLGAAGLTSAQEHNRQILQDTMCGCGFRPYQGEWWHFNLKDEPYPDTYFDFPIR
ncbi:MAG: M15 family metallopeptidase [Clostridiaceae bacterium]|nr:M15 family metallopeptidase [Clostridiaceae bacterium]